MTSYSDTLKAHLSGDARQEDFAAEIKRSQAAVSRYITGARFPDAATAREIERATNGAVPFALWQAEMLTRLGIEEAA